MQMISSQKNRKTGGLYILINIRGLTKIRSTPTRIFKDQTEFDLRIGRRICDNAYLIRRDCTSHRKCINTQRGQTANTKERAFQELVLDKIRKMDVIKNIKE
jgi:hypothetical protein